LRPGGDDHWTSKLSIDFLRLSIPLQFARSEPQAGFKPRQVNPRDWALYAIQSKARASAG